MTLRQYLTVMTLATLMCWTALVLVILNVDPFQANWLSLIFFYLSLFSSLLGTLALLFFLLFQFFRQSPTAMFRQVTKSFRFGCFASAALTALAYLLGRGWLQWWNAVVFLAALLSFVIFMFFHRRTGTASNSSLL